MPALPDTATFAPPVRGPLQRPRAHPQHPSPTRDGLALEIMTAKEIGYHNLRFGIDTPYWMVPLGWGEYAPLVG
jgi:hypothetical protein